MKKFFEIFEWYGMFAILIAYFMVSFEIIRSTRLSFQLLNITGSIGIILISFHKKAHQPGVLNIIWAMIVPVPILRIISIL